MDRACQILDLWLAVTPLRPIDWSKHHIGKIRSFFDSALSIVDNRRNLDQTSFHLLTLLYRGLLKLAPEYAGEQYPNLCRLAHRTRGQDAKSIWLALCWEYGVLLGADQAWRACFVQGLTSIGEEEKNHYRRRDASDLNDLFRRGLEHLDHLERDLYPSESSLGCLLEIDKREPTGSKVKKLLRSGFSSALGRKLDILPKLAQAA